MLFKSIILAYGADSMDRHLRKILCWKNLMVFMYTLHHLSGLENAVKLKTFVIVLFGAVLCIIFILGCCVKAELKNKTRDTKRKILRSCWYFEVEPPHLQCATKVFGGNEVQGVLVAFKSLFKYHQHYCFVVKINGIKKKKNAALQRFLLGVFKTFYSEIYEKLYYPTTTAVSPAARDDDALNH
ncbi:hypothetical protein FF38_03255 [Lucilia cuprina]|uniref:Uncharacterized protein n=1 Tax=Lucilia cuprina TaxID=7375 RepID=A0A0L0CIY2_LUCCU|nr:hypothetical protein FF38_03255 [Lucilia cuprina]